jgi:hypothetical protein
MADNPLQPLATELATECKQIMGLVSKPIKTSFRKIKARLKKIHNFNDIITLLVNMGVDSLIFVATVFPRTVNWFNARFQNSRVWQRRAMHLLKGLLALATFGFTIYGIYKEQGLTIFNDAMFLALLCLLAYLGLGLFLKKWDDLGQKTSDEKMDELLTEIKGLRQDIKEGKNGKSNTEHYDSTL